jgi:uncharacterized protein involved in exopolysaccharide biosynthesis
MRTRGLHLTARSAEGHANPAAADSPGLANGLIDDGLPSGVPDLRPVAESLWKSRTRIGICAAIGAALAIGAAFVIPPTYVATCTVLEAPRPGGGSALDQLGLSAEALGFKSSSSVSNALTYPDILRSRRLLETLLDQSFATAQGASHKLIDHIMPGTSSPQRTELALKELRERLDIALDRRTNLMRVGIKDSDPVLAAAVANAACARLQDIVMRGMMTQAGATRRFVEEQLATAEQELSRAEGAATVFRTNNLHVDGSPRLMLEQTRLMREARTREEVVLALTRQYETAKVDENRDVPVINVLDPAVPPAFASAPRRAIMAVAGLLLGLIAGAVWCWPREQQVAAIAAEVRAA